ncbi:MAG: InlB B-repeat-containing protein, partial [Clostridia bacterium]|nr:InlB B-repeat-containing protein [Clostridia bacterium]
VHPELDELFWAAGEFEDLKFPCGYWLSDIPYTIPVPNPTKEGRRFYGWNAYPKDGIGGFNMLTHAQGDYSNLTVQWAWDYEQRYEEYYKDVNIIDAGEFTLFTAWDALSKTIYFDPNGGTINGRDKWIAYVNTVDRIETDDPYGSTVPDDADFGLDLKDLIPERTGYVFLGWCSDPSTEFSTQVTYDDIAEVYRYFWEYDPYGTDNDKNTKQRLYARWGSLSEYDDDDTEEKGWKLDDDGTLYIFNDTGAKKWRKASFQDINLAFRVKKVVLGYKDEYPTYLPDKCFEFCRELEEITFEKPLVLGEYLFSRCSSLKSITFNFDVQNTSNLANVFYSANKDIVIHVPDEFIENYRQALGDYAYLLEPVNGQRYPLSVNGEMLTDDKLTVQCGDGTASFDPSTNTLTLNNARLTETMTPHCIDNVESDDTAYSKAAVVSGLDDLKIVIDGQSDIVTDGNNCPEFVRAYGDLEISGPGLLKGTKEYLSDEETPDNPYYTDPGMVRITALSNLTLTNITAERLFAEVSKDIILNKATLYGGQIIADGNITAQDSTVKMFIDPEDDSWNKREPADLRSNGTLSIYKNCILEYLY